MGRNPERGAKLARPRAALDVGFPLRAGRQARSASGSLRPPVVDISGRPKAPAYPVWSATIITVGYSFAVHGREVDAYGT